MSMNQLYDLSKVYMEQIASVDEAVKGQDTEMRKAASAERAAERTKMGGKAAKIPGKEGPSVGKTYADYQQISIKGHDKATKGKYIHGMTTNEELMHRDAKTGEVVKKSEIGKTYYPAQKMKKTSVALEKEKRATNEALDPVGKEDADVDNDGVPNTKSDKYIMKRRKAIGKAIATRKESFSNWRQDLSEVMDTLDEPDDLNHKEIKEKKIENKIKINPDFKEAVEEIGGQLIEMVEVEEGYHPIGREKESAMYRRAGNLARTSLSSRGKKKEEAQTKSAKIVSAITRQKEKERFDRIGQSPAHNEEFELDEKTLTPAETKKKEEIVKSMKKNLSGFKSRYGERAKEVMYATATKQAKKVAEATMPGQDATPPAPPKPDPSLDGKRKALINQQKKIEYAKLQALNKGMPITTEESDALALVRASVAKQYGAKAVVGSAANKRAQAAKAAQPKPQKPQRKLPGYSIPGAPPEKSYND